MLKLRCFRRDQINVHQTALLTSKFESRWSEAWEKPNWRGRPVQHDKEEGANLNNRLRAESRECGDRSPRLLFIGNPNLPVATKAAMGTCAGSECRRTDRVHELPIRLHQSAGPRQPGSLALRRLIGRLGVSGMTPVLSR